ncbi:MAG: SusC/RagA family TonB-linked outer membrane protein [Bacteroidia bacterium]
MRKTITLFALMLAFFTQHVFAQQRTISGTVTSKEDTKGIPGVSVVVVGTTNGTTTDIDGKFNLTVDSTAKQIKFSGIGLMEQTVDLGASNQLNIVMVTDVQKLNEVVITALNIPREKKSLGYATQQIAGKELTEVHSGNFVNQLSGKVSGVNIRDNGNMGGSTNIIIRGSTSLRGDNQALVIVDGIPMDNSRNHSFRQDFGRAGYDYGSPVSDINPFDITSVNVLKGAASTALYGSRAARGVIQISTKRGQIAPAGSNQRLGVTINSGVNYGMVDKKTFPTYQNEYGAGYGPYYGGPGDHFFLENVTGADTASDGSPNGIVTPYTEDASYGGAFSDTLMVYQWAAFVPGSPTYHQKTPWVGHAANEDEGPISFFNTAKTFTNNVAIEGGTDVGSFRLSIGNQDMNGILPNSSIRKWNFGINGDFKLTDRFTAAASANYVRETSVGRNETGYNNNIMTSFRQWFETNVSVKELKEMFELTQGNYGWNPASSDAPDIPIFWDNPYFLRYKSFSSDGRDRLFGFASLNYKVSNAVNLSARVNIDQYSAIQEERLAKTSNAKEFGINAPGQSAPEVTSGYSRLNKTVRETGLDVMATFKKDFSDNLSFNGLVGTNFRRNYLNTIFASTNGGLVVPELYSISNSVNTPSAALESEQGIAVNGYYASVSLGFKRFLYLDLTARNDISSTLPADNNSYFYPGASVSFVFSELTKTSWMDFGKVRLNVAQVGNDAPWSSLNDVYSKPIAFGSTTLFSLPVTKNNSELKPELSLTKEAGLEMTFLNKRLGFDFAYYTTDTKNQIVPVAVTPGTGYSNKFVNAGTVRNTGFELSLYLTPVKTTNFAWTINLNYSHNNNKVVELFEGVENIQLANFQQGVTLNATVGEAYGTLKGTDFVYTNGQKTVGEDGYYLVTPTADNVLGDIEPDYIAGIGNTLTYKKWSFSFLVDIKKGGSIFTIDQAYGQATGIYPESVGTNDLGNPIRNPLTTDATSGGVILEGVILHPDGSTSPNDIRVAGDDYLLRGYASNPNSAFVYDASYVKLREVVLSYSLPLKATSFFSNVSFALVASNLWIIHKNLPYADPESGLSAGNIQGFQSGVQPAVKNYGFNLTLQF